jgi:hypothetical protein
MNHGLGTVFTPVDPALRQRGDEYAHHHTERVWYLPTGAENRIFPNPYINSEHARWNPTPWRPASSTIQQSLLRLPAELQLQILEHLLVLDGTIFVVYLTASLSNIPQTPRYFLGNPEWMDNANAHTYLARLSPHVTTHVWTLDGRLISGRFIDPTVMLSSVDSVDPNFRPLAIETFYGRNTFAIATESYHGRRTYPAGYHVAMWLHSLDPFTSNTVRHIEIRLEFTSRQHGPVRRLMRTLGARLDSHVTLRIDRNSLSSQQLANPNSIPGMDILRRFRGRHHIRIIIDPPISSLNVDPSLNAIRSLNASVQSWVTRPHLQLHPSEALVPRPLAISTLQGRLGVELERAARKYSYDPSGALQLSNGGLSSTRAQLALFIHAEQARKYYDALDASALPPRPQPIVTAGHLQWIMTQTPTAVSPAVQGMQTQAIVHPSAQQANEHSFVSIFFRKRARR